ncbi:GtrA family protein [Chitinimonas sp.]|uniref:GtrA family protein n=1 Tax=Chitinimonas sp. TaxID=1934313 RepID=UPI002F93B7F5
MTQTDPVGARRLPRFIVVGSLAAAVHWGTANLLMLGQMAPLLANVGGFGVAFVVSYLGQRHWTFTAGHLAHRHTLPRYFLLACSGFAGNEALFYLLLRYTPLPPAIALALVLGLVAVATFLLSRGWVFVRR